MKGAGMAALNIHLTELIEILEVSSVLMPGQSTSAEIRDQIAHRLTDSNPHLADRVRRLDDWQAEALADFVADAHTLAEFWEIPTPSPAEGTRDTRLG
jgi:hypothetical protein